MAPTDTTGPTTASGDWRTADGNGTIFVAPQGINNGWANSGGQDVTFVDDMLRQLEAGLCVDTTQVFSSGFSYGGAMTYALACARPTVFRAVAVYSGANLSGCSGGTQPVAYIGLHGLRDNVLPISSGRALRDTFVRNNGCTPQNPPEPANGSLTHIVTTYSGCRAGYPVVWAAFDGAGHDPGPIDGCTCDGWQTWTSGRGLELLHPVPRAARHRRRRPPPTGSLVNGRSRAGAWTSELRTTNGTQARAVGLQRRCEPAVDATPRPSSCTVYGNKCLDAERPGHRHGTAVIIWDCNGQANQQWNVNANGTITGVAVGPVPRRQRRGDRQRHADRSVDLQRREQPEVDPELIRAPSHARRVRPGRPARRVHRKDRR